MICINIWLNISSPIFLTQQQQPHNVYPAFMVSAQREGWKNRENSLLLKCVCIACCHRYTCFCKGRWRLSGDAWIGCVWIFGISSLFLCLYSFVADLMKEQAVSSEPRKQFDRTKFLYLDTIREPHPKSLLLPLRPIPTLESIKAIIRLRIQSGLCGEHAGNVMSYRGYCKALDR